MLAFVFNLMASLQGSWEPAFQEALKEGERGDVQIADLTDALTFARADVDGRRRVLAVTRYRGGNIDAVDLSAVLSSNPTDPIAAFGQRGYDQLLSDIRTAPPGAHVRVPASALVIPFDCADHHIAVGTNYPEHADDAGTVRPFLFPKLVQAGASGDDVAVRGGLLDYEVEIAVVTLEPLAGRDPDHLGLVLANDFTDREALMHAVDRHDIESGKGFTTGKSFPGYLPVGNLFVIPRDWKTFVRGLELRLFVNEALRQRSSSSEMVWDVSEVLAQTLARKGVRWDHRGNDISLFDGDAIPARTLILTGTPHGTVFSGVPAAVIASGLVRWLAGGWNEGLPGNVIRAYVDAARHAEAYLQPGDEVFIHVARLGELKSRVVD